MAITTAVRTLSTTASIIATAGSGNDDRSTVIVKGASADIYIGGSDVTTSTGVLMSTTDAVALDLGQGDVLYGIAASGTPTVRVLQTRK